MELNNNDISNQSVLDKYILGIETSCDDTAIALIRGNEILANVVLKQEHKKGVIPEYAARAHHVALFEHAREVIKNHTIDLVAYTNEPGLVGSLFVGANFAKSLAYMLDVPSIAINHLAGHMLLPYWLSRVADTQADNHLQFPYLCLLVSGGHTMIVLVEDVEKYRIISTTLDDAVGEVFDKVARNIGLDYPGGPNIERLAQNCKDTGNKYSFPFVMRNRLEFSFSGLKTAAIEQINIDAKLEEKQDFCYAFQEHVAMLLTEKMKQTHEQYLTKHWVVSGGVAANKKIRASLDAAAKELGVNMHYPDIALCTDNGVMIACVGQLLYQKAWQQTKQQMLTTKPSAQSHWLLIS